MKYNLHTHSFYCRHGHGTIAEYVQAAERNKFELLGFSEHMPLPGGVHASTRMYNEQMPQYEKDVKEAGKRASIPVLLGYECDYYPEFDAYCQSVAERVDYLIFGVHFIRHEGGPTLTPFKDTFDEETVLCYRDQFKAAAESGLFTFAAHPDLFHAGYGKWDDFASSVSKELITIANDCHLPLEINGNGFLKGPLENGRLRYPVTEFWSMAKAMHARIITNSDAHEVSSLSLLPPRLASYVAENDLPLASVSLKEGKLVIR